MCLIPVVVLARAGVHQQPEGTLHAALHFPSAKDSYWSSHLGHSALWPTGKVPRAPLSWSAWPCEGHLELHNHFLGTEWGPQLGAQETCSPADPGYSPAHMRSWCWEHGEDSSCFWDLTGGLEIRTGQTSIQQFCRSGLEEALGTNQMDPFRTWCQTNNPFTFNFPLTGKTAAVPQ